MIIFIKSFGEVLSVFCSGWKVYDALNCNFVSNRQLSSPVREIFLMLDFALAVFQEKTWNPRFD